jgi:DNA repair protein RadC
MGILRDNKGNYRLTGKTTEQDVLAVAEGILLRKLERQGSVANPSDAADFLRMRLGRLVQEQFVAVWLDNRHRILATETLASGTIDGASIHVREVLRAALTVNAAAVIFSHNHPSGVTEPSAADRAITRELKDALQLIGVRTLDHVVVGAGSPVSMAARGLV